MDELIAEIMVYFPVVDCMVLGLGRGESSKMVRVVPPTSKSSKNGKQTRRTRPLIVELRRMDSDVAMPQTLNHTKIDLKPQVCHSNSPTHEGKETEKEVLLEEGTEKPIVVAGSDRRIGFSDGRVDSKSRRP